ncbi:MAG: DUF721 domain-containing protein [Actinomycetota bacterium]|nr:DUF721 domain-containing protein [Actinomycetota bacterium]
MNPRGPEKIGGVIKLKNIAPRGKRREKLKILELNWRFIVGERLSERTKPGKLSKGTLFVNTENSSWGTEVSAQSEEIKRKAENLIGPGSIEKVKVRVKAPRTLHREGETASESGKPSPSSQLSGAGVLGKPDSKGADNLEKAILRFIKAAEKSKEGEKDDKKGDI